MESVTTLSTLLSIVIACMGLAGLVAYSVTQRTKEIGIRKALGANTGRLLFLLSSDYLRLIVIAMMIAIPVVGIPFMNFCKAMSIA